MNIADADADGHYVLAPPTPAAVPRGRGQDDGNYVALAEPMADKLRAESESAPSFSEQENPLASASVASIAWVHWFQPVVSLGARRVLEMSDMWPICAADSCHVVEQRFRAVYRPAECGAFGMSPVAMAFIRAFRGEIAVVLANSIVYILGLSLQSYIAQAILQFLTGEENLFRLDSGYALLAMMTAASLVAMGSLNYAFFISSRTGANMRSLTMDLVYQKSLKLSSAARQEYTAGEVLTLMSVDAERVFNAMLQCVWIVVGLVSFVISVVLIGFLFNALSALGGAVVLALVCTISVQEGNFIARVQHDLLNVIDERVKVTSEALQGIRVMKFYAWEESLARRVEKIRAVEIDLLRKYHFHQVANTVMLFLTPVFMSGVTLGIYVLINGSITIVEAFTLVAMVNISRAALIQLPVAIGAFSQAQIAFRRIDAYLTSDEVGAGVLLEDGHISNLSDQHHVERGGICIRNAEFEWPRASAETDVVVITTVLNGDGEDDDDVKSIASRIALSNASLMVPESSLATRGAAQRLSESAIVQQGFRLEGVNIEVDPGTLVMIVGTVGAGKSSLLSAILGEMALTAGHVDVRGEIAYVSQETWIRNLNVRENILFESEFEADRYKAVLKATQLSLDLNALPHGDQTEIGERGINLSGGQKARVAIARAMYRRDYDILILDDPLSAVDPHVAHAIFEQCVLGLAHDKTRLLVLNSHYDLLEHADKVLVVRDGCIAGDGTFNEIIAQFPELGGSDIVAGTLAAEENSIEEESKCDDGPAVDEAVLVVEEGVPAQLFPVVVDQKAVDGSDEDQVGRLIQDEDRVKGTVSKHIYKSYFDETGFNGLGVILLIIVAYVISQAVRTIVDWWPGHWARAMAADNPTYSGTTFGMWYIGLIVFCSVLTFGRAVFVTELCIRTSKNLHDELFRRVLGAPINTYFDVTPVGRILNRFSNDLDQLDSVLPQEYQILAQHTSLALGSLVVSAFASYWIGIAYIPIIVVFVVTGQYFKKTSCEIKRLEGISRTPVYNLFGETLNGLQTIRAFKMQRAFEEANKKAVDANSALYITYWAAGRWLASRLDLLSVVIIFMVTLYLVATKGQIGALTAGLALTYSLMLTSVVQWVMRSLDKTESAMTSVERLLHFREIPAEMQTPLGSSNQSTLLPSEWPAKGSIHFDELCLKYRPELPLVLRGVSMQVAGGEKVGICGRTGAGKSSLMIALFRICEFESGTVRIDGVDIRQVALHDLRRRLAIIPQDPVLFSGSLRENLDPFGEYTDESIWRVLEQVHMAMPLRKWGAGLDFEVSESGDNLSVGQRQLLCIGRALLKDSKIVVLDEATANVDTATDELIQVTIKQTFVDKTVLIIAHRINTIMHCDKIAVMDAGQVAEFGAPQDLLQRSDSIFSALASKAAVSHQGRAVSEVE